MKLPHAVGIWLVCIAVALIPLLAALNSPLLEWREPIYIVAGASGVIAIALLLFQPLLARGWLPGLTVTQRQRCHRMVGAVALLAVVLHVVGLWFTSPPDVIDALLFVSPTPFSVWGVVAMWAFIATVGLLLLRRRLGLSPRMWRTSHKVLGAVIVAGSVVHALLIDGTMEVITKSVFCAVLVVVTALALAPLKR